MSGAALVGGETAEMPGMYQEGDYDLAGFSVGIVEKDRIINGSGVNPGDILIGIASSGPHSNGYSLIRKIIEIYVKPILTLIEKVTVHTIAHITGGGLLENLPRVIPENTCAIIDPTSWQHTPIFDWLQSHGEIDDEEMYRTFNCGVGMVVCVNATDQNMVLECLAKSGETAWIIGKIKKGEKDQSRVTLI